MLPVPVPVSDYPDEPFYEKGRSSAVTPTVSKLLRQLLTKLAQAHVHLIRQALQRLGWSQK